MKRVIGGLLAATLTLVIGGVIGGVLVYRSSSRLLLLDENTGELVQELRCGGRVWHREKLPLNYLMSVAPGALGPESKLIRVSMRSADGARESWNRGSDFLATASDLGAGHLMTDEKLSALKLKLAEVFADYSPDAVEAFRREHRQAQRGAVTAEPASP